MQLHPETLIMEIKYIVGTWEETYKSIEEFERDCNETYRGDGWYFGDNFFALVMTGTNGEVELTTFGEDPRPMFKSIVEMPKYPVQQKTKLCGIHGDVNLQGGVCMECRFLREMEDTNG